MDFNFEISFFSGFGLRVFRVYDSISLVDRYLSIHLYFFIIILQISFIFLKFSIFFVYTTRQQMQWSSLKSIYIIEKVFPCGEALFSSVFTPLYI